VTNTIDYGQSLGVMGRTGTGRNISSLGRVVLTAVEIEHFTAPEKRILPPKVNQEDIGLISR